MAIDKSMAAICVQDVDVQSSLRFTLIHTVGCTLHRPTNRVIHRIQFYIHAYALSARWYLIGSQAILTYCQCTPCMKATSSQQHVSLQCYRQARTHLTETSVIYKTRHIVGRRTVSATTALASTSSDNKLIPSKPLMPRAYSRL